MMQDTPPEHNQLYPVRSHISKYRTLPVSALMERTNGSLVYAPHAEILHTRTLKR